MNQVRFRMPLLHDHHSHPLLYASFGDAVSLESVTDKQQALDLLRAQLESEKAVELTLAYGWRSHCFSWTQHELDSLGAVAIFNVSLHDLKLSSAASERLSLLYGDDVLKVSDQVWYEQNFRKVLNWFANLNATPAALTRFYQQLEALGVYSAEELLLVDEREIELFHQAELVDRTRFWASPETFDTLSAAAQTHVSGCKLFTDGAIGARTAALSQPYRQQNATSCPFPQGMLVYENEELQSTIEQCLHRTPNLAIHAIGDTAIQQTVATLERVQIPDAREIRIEHAQLIRRDVAERAKALGVILSMQPNFNEDSWNYADRMEPSFCRLNNDFSMLIGANVTLRCGRSIL